MSAVEDEIAYQRALERLRQERDTFEQRKKQDGRAFWLRIVMCYIAVALLAGVAVVSSIILLHPGNVSTGAQTAAGAALFGDVLATAATVYKVVVTPGSLPSRLDPIAQ